MELKAGYKQTEIGVIPEEWSVSTVGQEFDVKLGKMLDAEKNFGAYKPYLGNRAVQWDRIDCDDLPCVRMSRSDMERYRLQKGDLLVCEGGEVGRAAVWDAPIDECYYQKALHRLRPLRGFDVRVMAGLLRLWSERGLLANYVTQTSIAHLPRERFMEVPMPVPTPEEQLAIAGALSDVDALLRGLERLISKKRDLKQGATQQLLTGRSRLSGFDVDRGRKETLLGSVPESWGVALISEVAIRGSDGIKIGPFGSALKKEYLTRQGFKVYGQENVFANDMSIGDRYVDANRFAELRTCEIQPGDFLISMMGTVGHCLIVPPTIEAGIMDSHLLRIRLNRDLVRPEFLLQLFRTQLILDQIKRLSVGGIMEGLSSKIVRRIAVPLPKVEEQEAIAASLSGMDVEIAALEVRRDKTRAIKQAMLQELLTGKTRLVKREPAHA